MSSFTIKLPAMYADHHVQEVRRLLLALPGVKGIYASSAFQVADIEYDDAQLHPDQIEACLQQAGYLEALATPMETGKAANEQNTAKPYFRHTVAYAQAGTTVGFGQNLPSTGRALWPCPGIGTLSKTQDMEDTRG